MHKPEAHARLLVIARVQILGTAAHRMTRIEENNLTLASLRISTCDAPLPNLGHYDPRIGIEKSPVSACKLRCNIRFQRPRKPDRIEGVLTPVNRQPIGKCFIEFAILHAHEFGSPVITNALEDLGKGGRGMASKVGHSRCIKRHFISAFRAMAGELRISRTRFGRSDDEWSTK